MNVLFYRIFFYLFIIIIFFFFLLSAKDFKSLKTRFSVLKTKLIAKLQCYKEHFFQFYQQVCYHEVIDYMKFKLLLSFFLSLYFLPPTIIIINIFSRVWGLLKSKMRYQKRGINLKCIYYCYTDPHLLGYPINWGFNLELARVMNWTPSL